MTQQFLAIKEYIPQREPFIMVSELVKVTETDATSVLDINEENIFSENGYFLEPGIIENIAQTAAAMTGYHAVTNKTEVKKGYIGAIKNLKIHQLPKVESKIETTIVIENQVMNVHIVNGYVKQAGTTIAECEMRIFLDE